MGNDELVKILDEFIAKTKIAGLNTRTSRYETVAPREECLQLKSVVERIFEVIAPNWKEMSQPTINQEFSMWRDTAIQVRELILREDLINQLYEAKRTQFPGNYLREDLWEEIDSLWNTNHFRESIAKAGEFADQYLKDLTRRADLSGAQLIQESFSVSEAQVGKPRLRNTPEMVGDEAKNLVEGIKNLGLGCSAFIRNLSTHSLDAYSEYEALSRIFAINLYLDGLDRLKLIYV